MIATDLTREITEYGQKITFITKDKTAVDKIFDKYLDKPLEVKIEPVRHKRSLDANGYLWVLCDKIAKEIGTTKVEVYKSHIRDVGRFDDVCVVEKAAKHFVEKWNEKGDGWLAEIQPVCQINGCEKVRCYYGSSVYDTREMSILINNIIYEAKELDIETLTPNELEELKQKWGV